MKNAIFILIVLTWLVGCGGEGADPGPEGGGSNSENDGEYRLSVAAKTQYANDGGTCADGAVGTMEISNSQISGRVIDTVGGTYTLTGSVDSSGKIVGGFALSGDGVVDFSGDFGSSLASGVWVDIYGCSGIWFADSGDTSNTLIDSYWFGRYVSISESNNLDPVVEEGWANGFYVHFRGDGVWGFSGEPHSYLYFPGVNTWSLNGRYLTIYGGNMHYIFEYDSAQVEYRAEVEDGSTPIMEMFLSRQN